MAAQEGRPYCRKGGRYIFPSDWENANLSPQCRECSYIIYVGCPGFEGSTKQDQAVLDYIGWHRGEKNTIDPKKWWFISDQDVQIIKKALIDANEVEALHTLASGLHTTDYVPDDWKKEAKVND